MAISSPARTGAARSNHSDSLRAEHDKRIERLSHVSARRVIDPDVDVVGEFGDGQLVPDELLMTYGTGIELTPEQKVVLSREQTAALLDGGVRLESALMAGFGLMLTTWRDVTDPRITYLLHEVGEETRHSRLFVRMVGQLQPKARNPFNRGINRKVGAWLYRVTASNPLLLFTMVLAGEEIPDLLQKRAVEHPDTDDYLRRVNRYHREEEARHLAFGRMVLPELWSRRPRHERWLVRRVAPHLTRLMVETQLTHPGIYAEAGLPMHRTARAVARSQHHKDFLAEAMRPVLKTVLGAAPELIGKVPRGWRRLCQVDKQGNLLPLATAAA